MLENQRELGGAGMPKHTGEQEEEEKANKSGGQGHRRNRCMVEQEGVSEHTEWEGKV